MYAQGGNSIMKEKRELDEVDLELLDMLAKDGRRPWSDLADQVGLSPPAVSDRIDRLREQGIIRRFTVDIDRIKLQNRTPVFLRFDARPTAVDELFDEVIQLESVENAFKMYDGTIFVHGNAPGDNPKEWLHSGIDMERVENLEINILEQYERRLNLDRAEFSLPCAECGNTVDSQGVSVELNGDTVSFCCTSCRVAYEDRLEQYQAQSA